MHYYYYYYYYYFYIIGNIQNPWVKSFIIKTAGIAVSICRCLTENCFSIKMALKRWFACRNYYCYHLIYAGSIFALNRNRDSLTKEFLLMRRRVLLQWCYSTCHVLHGYNSLCSVIFVCHVLLLETQFRSVQLWTMFVRNKIILFYSIIIIFFTFFYPRYLESRGLKAYTKNCWNYYYYSCNGECKRRQQQA